MGVETPLVTVLVNPRSKERGDCPDLQVGKTLKTKNTGL
jgi:hypothetical protein